MPSSLLPLFIAASGLTSVLPASAGPEAGTVNVVVQSTSKASSSTSRSTKSNQIEAQQGQTVVTASVPAKGFDKPYGYHLQPILSKIGASDSQRKQITVIVEQYRPKLEPMRVEYRQKSREFIDFIITGKPAEVIMARQVELNNLYGVIITQYSLMRLEIRRLLSPQQCMKYEEYRQTQGWRSK
jgi:Spy/CpxP family protein refolding chaperone